jgi:hypothetical protein
VNLRSHLTASAPSDQPNWVDTLGAPVEFAAAAADASGSKALRRFAMTAYTGVPINLNGSPIPTVIDLEHVTVPGEQIPILLNHDPERIVGHASVPEVSAQRIRISDGVLSGTGPEAAAVAAMADNGFVWQASVGGNFSRAEFVEPGQSVLVNGRRWQGPLRVVRAFALREVSFVSMGADGQTSARMTAGRPALEKGNSNMGFEAWLAAKGFEIATLQANQLASLRALWQQEQTATAAAGLAPAAQAISGQATATGTNPAPAPAGAVVASHVATAPAPAAAAANGFQCAQPAPGVLPVAGQPLTASAAGPAGGGQPAGQCAQPAPGLTAAAATPPQFPAGYHLGVTPQAVIDALAQQQQLQANAAIDRELGIRRLCGDRVDLAEQALAAGWDLRQTELAVHRARRPQAPGRSGSVSDECRNEAIECSLVLATGYLTEQQVAATVPTERREQVMNLAVSREVRGFSLHGLFDMVLHAANRRFTGGTRRSDQYLNEVRDARNYLQANGFSTFNVQQLLENVVNKTLLPRYTNTPGVWRQFCGVRTTTDFKPAFDYRLDPAGRISQVGAQGELKHINLTSTRFALEIDTYGALFSLDRKMMINDDLGAFLEIPAIMGEMMAQRVEEAALVTLLSGRTAGFISVGNNNLLTGTAAALSISGLNEVSTQWKNRVLNNKPITLVPDRLLVPTTLTVTADVLYREANVMVTTDVKKPEPASNPHRGRYLPLESPYLNNDLIKQSDAAASAIPNQSATRYFALSAPNGNSAVKLGFLNGQQAPTAATAEAPFNQLGQQFRLFLDFGTAYGDQNAVLEVTGVAP